NPPLAVPLTFNGAVRLNSALTTALNPGNASPALAPASVSHDFENSYIQSWNLNVQREVTPTLGVMVGYFGSKGTNLRLSRNLNQFANGVRPFPTISSQSPILPSRGIGNITDIASIGSSNYNALWISANKRLSKGLQFNASYTFSKSLDYNSLNSQGAVIQDRLNARGDRGLSDFDARHRFVISAIYELPFKGNRLVEGWQVTTIAQLQSGNPVNLVVGNALLLQAGNPALAALNGSLFTGVATLRPDVVGSITVTGNPDQWFSNLVWDPRLASACPASSTFALPVAVVNGKAVGHFGNLGRNVIIGPDFKNLDFSVVKTTRITEAVKVQFRSEFFDLFNHANFGQPGRVVQQNSATFG